jgi:glycosyltransferase involved in cell wall biosynthesis
VTSEQPAVSVIVPCYNLGAFLDEAVGSVLAQSFQDFEILIVDDGSTEEATRALLATYERPRTSVFRTENRGLAAARNFLIARARGRYLCALDADDKLHPHYLEKTVAVLDGDPSLAFASTRLQMFGEIEGLWPDDERCDLTTLLCEDTVHTAALVRRDAVIAVGGYDVAMPAPGDEDWDLWISLVEAGYRGVVLPEVLFFYRRRPGSMVIECTSRPVHLTLYDYLLDKHAASYHERLIEVLLRKEEVIGDLLRRNAQIEAEIGGFLAPAVELRRAELRSLAEKRDRLAAAAAVARECDRARAEVAALRSSASWRLTAPLRAAYDLLRGRRGSGS